jgi:hypothetical protein
MFSSQFPNQPKSSLSSSSSNIFLQQTPSQLQSSMSSNNFLQQTPSQLQSSMSSNNFLQQPVPVTKSVPININGEFNLYSTIETEILNIKKLSIFTELQDMQMSDLYIISNISVDCIEKLGNISSIYIKKINNNSVLNNTLNLMYEKHLSLMTKIINFNNIYNEVANNLKHLSSLELSAEEKNFTFLDIFLRYKIQVYDIISDIKILNTYKTL